MIQTPKAAAKTLARIKQLVQRRDQTHRSYAEVVALKEKIRKLRQAVADWERNKNGVG